MLAIKHIQKQQLDFKSRPYNQPNNQFNQKHPLKATAINISIWQRRGASVPREFNCQPRQSLSSKQPPRWQSKRRSPKSLVCLPSSSSNFTQDNNQSLWFREHSLEIKISTFFKKFQALKFRDSVISLKRLEDRSWLEKLEAFFPSMSKKFLRRTNPRFWFERVFN